MNHITDINEPFLTAESALALATKSHTQGAFTISTRKLPISKAQAIDSLTERIGIPMPEMIFGDNLVRVVHDPSSWSIEFNTPDALDAVDKTDRNMLKVAYARDWESTRESQTQGIKEVVKPYDWSYSTDYAGTVSTAAAAAAKCDEKGGEGKQQPAMTMTATTAQIPIELLKRRDPILFFDEVVLYESELDDNGVSIYSAKVRVHEKRMLLLCRLFMRLDRVLFRIRDTRVYVDFETQVVLREYTAKEAAFDQVRRKLLMMGSTPDEVTASMRDPNQLDPLLDTLEQRTEEVCLATTAAAAAA
ncbi:TipA protein [Moelleriella libera RCEF 2490]|uniref:TipA protein n=1 Tax=Moelleriella libera RCEF 2490 TaxID=1081109 RepID=A0A166VLJ0_9HYPO|nr:TipA protein [Moelleriella libera RCEF 2490]